MHRPDPVSAPRQLAGLVRPGGVIPLSETDIGAVRSVPESPQFRAVTEGIVSAFRAVGPSVVRCADNAPAGDQNSSYDLAVEGAGPRF